MGITKTYKGVRW